MSTELYIFFFITTIMLVLVPGPSAIRVATQGASSNAKMAFFSVLGVASADALFFALSATGIASLIVASNLIFSVIKWFGVLYLFYLGISAIFSKTATIKVKAQSTKTTATKAFSQGLIVHLANPKALMYFAALLPQFIDPNKPLALQLLIMGFTCILADLLVYSMFGYAGGQLARRQLKTWAVSMINKVAGVALITTGIRMVGLESLGSK